MRLGLVGFFSARSLRSRRGLGRRNDAVPSVFAGAVAAAVLQLVLGLLSAGVTGTSAGFGPVMLSLGQWLVFPLLGVLFVSPGSPDRRWRRVPVGRVAR